MYPSTRIFKERFVEGTWAAVPEKVPCCKCGALIKLPHGGWYLRQWEAGKVKCSQCAAKEVSGDAYSRYPRIRRLSVDARD